LGKSYDDSPIPQLPPAKAWLKDLFSVPEDPTLTISAYQRYCYSQEPADVTANKQVLTATPAYLHATQDHLVLNPAAALNISAEQAFSLASTANAFLAQDDIELKVLAPDCWLLVLPEPLSLSLHGSLQASGRNIHAYMPSGPDGRRLRATLNEIQMLWHDHPVNESRMSSGEMPINSLWIEGSVSASSHKAPTGVSSVISDSPTTRGLAIASGIANAAPIPPEGIGPAMAQAETLIELTGGDVPAQLNKLMELNPLPTKIVLCDQRNRLELLSSPKDRFYFWRKNALTVATAHS